MKLRSRCGECRLPVRPARVRRAGWLLGAGLVLLPPSVAGPAWVAEAQTLVRGPYLQSGTSSSVIVKWRTDEATESVVHYGLDPDGLTLSATNSTSTTEHAVQLTGLSADVKYFYAVGTSSVTLAGGDSDHFVVTAPVPGTAKPTRIWVIGDSGTANDNARAVRDAFLEFTESRDPDLWIMLGDNAYDDGTDAEYQAAVFDTYPQVLPRTVLWPTLGNHDGRSADSTTESGPYYDIFSLPRNGEAGGVASETEAYYSFDYGNMHFICLDSYETDRSADGAMMTWLEADLDANDREWVIAFWHHAPYSKGPRDSDEVGRSILLRENAVPLLERYGVDLVLTGHSHAYERSYLIDGHYGFSDTFTDAMKKNPGDGSATGDGAYQKPVAVGAPRAGAVYVVAGTAGYVKPGPFNHPAMAVSIETLGSMVLDVNGSRLDAMFLDSTGNIRDDFAILKVLGTVPTFNSLATHPTKDPFTVTISFSEPVTGLTGSEIEVTNGAGSNFSGSGATYRLRVTPDTDFDGDVTVTVPAGAAEDSSMIPNEAGSATFAVDTLAPALAAANGAAASGATLTLTFDEAPATANTPASAFAVTGGTTRTISGVSVNGTAVQLTIAPPVLYGESGIEVDYTAPSREALADASGNKVASFEDRAVSNETPATTLSTGVSLSLDTASVSEGGSAKSVALTAMLNRSARPVATAMTVEVGTTGDTATEGTDYAAVDDLTLTIPAYMTGITVRFTLTPMNDRIDEPGESLTVTGSTAVAGLIVTPPGGLALDIDDNDPSPSPALSVNASTIDEDGGTATVTVSTGSGSTFATDQTVRLAVAGTATEAADYIINSKTLTLPAGVGTSASMVTATVTGLDDSLDDDGETIEITGSRNGAAFGSTQTIAIEDDDWPVLTVTFRAADYRVAEGEHVDLPVTLSAAPERRVTIPIEIEVAGGAEAVDYSVSPASLTFGASETDRTLRVSASNDSAVDPSEGVTLSFGTTLPERISEGGIAETTVAIRDTDFTFAPAFAAGSGTTESDTDVYAVSEASSALRLSLRLETPRGARVVDIADPVVVSLATRENAGGREADEDYATQRRSGTFGDYGEFDLDLSFAPGDFSDDGACGCARAEKAVSVDLFDDRVYERVEVFGLRLARKIGRLSLSSKDITIRIIEDDAEPALTLDANPVGIAEAGGASTVTVSTGAGSTFPSAQTIRLELGGTATGAPTT